MSYLVKRTNGGPLNTFHGGIFDILKEFAYPGRMQGLGLFSGSLANYSTEESETDHVIKVALPGHNKESVKVTMENGRLDIEARVEEHTPSTELIDEHSFAFKVPKTCDPNSVEASIQDGILTIRIKKVEETPGSEKTEIQVS